MADHEVFNQEKFWHAFKQDIANARARILIECPFLSYWRLKDLGRLLQNATNRGVVVCVFLQQESENSAGLSSEELVLKRKEKEELVELLRSWRIHINQRTFVHSKVAIIDQEIFWDGSLNILSHGSRTHERMNRWISREKVENAIVEQRLSCLQCQRNIACFAAYGESDWGQTLKVQREWQDKTQRDIAEGCGLNRTYLSKIENGRKPSARSLTLISKALKATVFIVPNHLASYAARALRRVLEADSNSRDL